MDNDDESSFTSSPNHFLLSTYKELSVDQKRINDDLKYKCCLCRKIFTNPILTCSTCVNAGQFYFSKYGMHSNKRREMLNKNDYEDVTEYSNKTFIHLSCADRMSLLEKINLEKEPFQFELQTRLKSSTEIHQMSTEIQVRKHRLSFVSDSIKTLREQIERKKQANIQTQQRINDSLIRIGEASEELNKIKESLKSSHDKIQIRIDIRTKQEDQLDSIRRERFDEVSKYLFPIERVSAIEDDLATRIKDLFSAQQTTVDEMTNDRLENDEVLIVADCKYRIINSCLPANGDYQIEHFHIINSLDSNTSDDPESPQSSVSHDLFEILSALSHACQLINVIAFFLHINLPFRLHQYEFNCLTIDCLRANIAKLNTNIYSACLSQGIPYESTNATYTLENLLKLLTLEKYPSRPESIDYSEEYNDILEKEVNDISRAFITDYWFDDDDEKEDATDLLNNSEWEAISQVDHIPDDPSIYEHSDSSSPSSSQHHSSIMSSSLDYLKSRSSGLLNSFVRNLKP